MRPERSSVTEEPPQSVLLPPQGGFEIQDAPFGEGIGFDRNTGLPMWPGPAQSRVGVVEVVQGDTRCRCSRRTSQA